MKRKKAWKRGLLGVAAVLAVYLFMTPMGALRLGGRSPAIPKRRSTSGPRRRRNSDATTIQGPSPPSTATGTPGQNWEVRQIGPFRYAVYYGWA